ncbi:MAG: copper amine oxidase N-terminal domain-containing protein [Eubacteriales bacterium]
MPLEHRYGGTQDQKTVGINKGSTKIAFVIGANTARVNGKSVSMPSSYIVNGVTMAPIRFVAESLGQQNKLE